LVGISAQSKSGGLGGIQKSGYEGSQLGVGSEESEDDCELELYVSQPIPSKSPSKLCGSG